AALGLSVTVEEASRQGRVDMVLAHAGHVYLFEFKTVADEAEGQALQQIVERGYADKYRGRGDAVHLIGVEFSRSQRQVVGFETQTL
ncbi:MAG: PD-(D/E)XK nuclease domain-containing protein, partial [Rhodocyclaceae bacterium]|nr:PD-(D/E)XK nuclease domain-containing protein [Rhodocyclaceae bacterium]